METLEREFEIEAHTLELACHKAMIEAEGILNRLYEDECTFILNFTVDFIGIKMKRRYDYDDVYTYRFKLVWTN